MIGFIVRRLLTVVPMLLVIATLCFILVRLAPGGPFDSERAIPEEIMRSIAAKYHLDRPLWEQYLRYMWDLLHGDLGPSFRYAGRSVNEIIADSWLPSALLGIAAIIYALVLGVATGTTAGLGANTLRDYGPMTFALLGIGLPSFVIGPLLVLGFGTTLRWFNVSGWSDPTDIVLPALSLGTIYAAYISRLSRAGILDVVNQDYVRTARSKGLQEGVVIRRHVMRGAMMPVITFMGPAIAGVMTGSFVIETIFQIPGLGRFFVQSALNRDYTLLVGTVLLYSFLVVILNLIVDIAYVALDPRLDYAAKR